MIKVQAEYSPYA